jgi:ABC-type ATPase with predicted acetyltransferase domain
MRVFNLKCYNGPLLCNKRAASFTYVHEHDEHVYKSGRIEYDQKEILNLKEYKSHVVPLKVSLAPCQKCGIIFANNNDVQCLQHGANIYIVSSLGKSI